MDLERLKKLVRLANNNPNDNEANVAARRVCKMLEDANFNLSPSPQKSSVTTHGYTPPPGENPFHVNVNISMEDILKDLIDMERKMKNARPAPPKSPYIPYEEKIPKSKSEKRMLKCSKCGQIRETPFVGQPFAFVCAGCAWERYEENRQKQKEQEDAAANNPNPIWKDFWKGF